MGSGKTTWVVNEMLNKNPEKNILYITPYLDEIDRIISTTIRDMKEPIDKGSGKIGNISKLLENQVDIACTHALFRKFDAKCKEALEHNKYTLILDETLTAVEPYHFTAKEDYQYLLDNNDIKVDSNGLIEWIGSELNTRFDDVRILAQNKCLFKVDDKFFLWHFPHEIFSLFEEVYVLTYLFEGSIMKYYFDLYRLKYTTKSIRKTTDEYKLVDYYRPNKKALIKRIKIYDGELNYNFSQKSNVLSSTWCKSSCNKKDLVKLKNNLYNYIRHIVKTNSNNIMWTTFKDTKKELKGKGYTNGFVACNCRATNDFSDRTCLMYCVNWFENPEIIKFFALNGITVNQDAIALASLLQWIWRSNIRKPESNSIINIYIPSTRMRNLLKKWLYD